MNTEYLQGRKDMTEPMKLEYKVVGEHISHSCLYELEDHSYKAKLDKNGHRENIIENEDFNNNYWAVILVDEDGCYEDTIEDDFKSANEAWAYYDKLMKGDNK